MTATQYHSSDKAFLGAFFVIELFDDMHEERVSKYFSHYVMADDFLLDVSDDSPECEFEICCIETEDVLSYVLSIEEGEENV